MKNLLHYSSIIIISSIFISCKDNNQTLPMQGKVKRETVSIAPKIAGRVARINVTEGQTVHEGDTLAVLDVPELNSKMLLAEGAIESAQGQLDLALNGATSDQVEQVQGQIDLANSQLVYAKQSYERMKNMFADSLISAQQFDEVKSKYMAAQAQVKTLQAKKTEIVKGTRPETIQSAKGQVERAVGAKKEILQADRERYLLAPADMTIESITLKQGELATPGYTLINGTITNSVYFRFTIGEAQVQKFGIGTVFTVSPAYQQKGIQSKVVAIKQLPKYADNTSVSPNYKLGESIYELKLVPVDSLNTSALYDNSTVLIDTKQR
jgi:HlyD family secretion protein